MSALRGVELIVNIGTSAYRDYLAGSVLTAVGHIANILAAKDTVATCANPQLNEAIKWIASPIPPTLPGMTRSRDMEIRRRVQQPVDSHQDQGHRLCPVSVAIEGPSHAAGILESPGG